MPFLNFVDKLGQSFLAFCTLPGPLRSKIFVPFGEFFKILLSTCSFLTISEVLANIEKRCPQCYLQRMDCAYSPGTWVMSLCVNNFILTKENTIGSILGGQTWTKKYPFHFWNFFGRNETIFIIECWRMFGFLVGLFLKQIPFHTLAI